MALYDEGGKQIVTLAQLQSGSGPQLTLEDREGFRTAVGTTQTVTPLTGETHKTSAAAITMFDTGTNVIWKAP